MPDCQVEFRCPISARPAGLQRNLCQSHLEQTKCACIPPWTSTSNPSQQLQQLPITYFLTNGTLGASAFGSGSHPPPPRRRPPCYAVGAALAPRVAGSAAAGRGGGAAAGGTDGARCAGAGGEGRGAAGAAGAAEHPAAALRGGARKGHGDGDEGGGEREHMKWATLGVSINHPCGSLALMETLISHN